MTTPTLAQIQTALQSAVVTASGLVTGDVVYGFKSPAVRLPDEYIRIHLGSSQRKPIIETWSKSTLDSIATTTVAITQQVTLDYYHRSPETACAQLQTVLLRLQTRVLTNTLDIAGISVFRYGDVQSLPPPTQSTYLDRAISELTIHYLTAYTAPIAPSIQTVNGDVETATTPPKVVLFNVSDV